MPPRPVLASVILSLSRSISGRFSSSHSRLRTFHSLLCKLVFAPSRRATLSAMFSSFSSFAVAVLPIIGLAAASPTVTPYTDGQCKAVVPNYSYNTRNGTQMVNTPFSTGAGVSAFGNATLKGNYEQYSNLSFSVPAIPNGLGQSIFWKVSGLDSGCRVIFMKPFVNPATGPNIPGQVVLNVGNANECYYTDVSFRSLAG